MLIRSGAYLPDICIYGSDESEPGQRIAMVLPWKEKRTERELDIRVNAFQSSSRALRLRRKRRLIQWIVPPVAGFLVWLIFEPRSRYVIITVGGLFGLFSMLEQNRGLIVDPAGDGWFHLHGVNPKAVARLRQIQENLGREPAAGSPGH